jgi:hypothetical protein
MLRRNIKRRLALLLVSFVIVNLANLPGNFAGRSASLAFTGEATSLEPGEQPVSSETTTETRAQVSEAYGKLPLSFEINHGQTAPQVKFLSRGSGYNLFLTSNEAVLALSKEAAEGRKDVLKIKLVGAKAQPQVTGEGELPGKSNYFLGNDPQQWRTNVANYAKVKYDDVYPGIDMVYYGNGRQLEYDFIVAAGADPSQIKLSIEGAQRLRVDERGDLVLSIGRSEIRQHKPFVYQEVNGVKKEVAARYVLDGKRQFGFEVAEYDKSQPLVIDPVLVYSTFLGGSDLDSGRGITVDGDGFAYVTGTTASLNFPTTAGSAQPVIGGRNDAFVAKLNRTGSALVYSTFLGGESLDGGIGIAVRFGNVYVSGSTDSVAFPTTTGAFQTTFGGSQDAFLVRLNSTGSALVYSTYLGGNDIEEGRGIALNSSGDAFVTGPTESLNFPTTAGAFQTVFGGGIRDAFVTRLNSTGSALVYSTYLGGGNNDQGLSIATEFGTAYVTGSTASSNFPTTAGAFQPTLGGLTDAFVARLNSTGSALIYSSYLGGTGSDSGLGIDLDDYGDAYVTGSTSSSSFPTTAGAFQTAFGGITDAFVTKVNSAGSALVYSTFLGGTGVDSGQGITVGCCRAFVTGSTSSSNFPTTANAIQPANAGSSDAFITKLNLTGSALRFSSYLGGTGSDAGQAIARIPGRVFVTGGASAGFPTTTGAFQGVNAGSSDAFVVKIERHRR